jgi:ABC-2 type transport system permease protein
MTPSQILTSYYTIVRKEVVRMTRIWSQTFLPSIVTTTLYFAIFGAFIGSQLAKIGDFSYMQFIAPGLVMMSVITSSYSNVVGGFFTMKFQKNLEEIMVSPMPHWVVVLGFVSGGVVRGFIVGALVLGVSLFFTHLVVYNIFLILAAAILTCVLFSLAGLLNGIFAKGFDGISIVPTFVLTPLTYLGGVFYSVNRLPPFWREVSLYNPILYMVNVFRYGFLGISDTSVAWSFALLVTLTLILFGIALMLLQKGIGLRS